MSFVLHSLQNQTTIIARSVFRYFSGLRCQNKWKIILCDVRSVFTSFKFAFTESGNMKPRGIRLTSTLRQVTGATNQRRDFRLPLPWVFGWGFRNDWGTCGVFGTYLQGEGSSNCQLPTIVHLFNFVPNNLLQPISIPAIVSHFYFHVLSTWIVVACWKLTWIKKCSKLNKTAETSTIVDGKGAY